ncbi:MAG: metallophosphoesterase family protein [Ignavibacteriaceae bacterium]
MKKIAQISDLHFGTEDNNVLEGLLSDLTSVSPDVLVVSGDLTQRARTSQFRDAKDFLDKLPFPKVIVPGNHDIPLFDIFRRFLFPLTRYKKNITKDLSPVYEDDELVVFGINTARSLTWKEGRISVEQISEMKKTLCGISNSKFKIVVTHHPFIPPPGNPGIAMVGRSVKALKIIDECCVDLLLAGHLHHGYNGDIRPYYPARERSVISAQAGTAISNRRRNEQNAYNIITVERKYISIEIRTWNDTAFENSLSTVYKLTNNEWIRES